jgi:hypothetical protein
VCVDAVGFRYTKGEISSNNNLAETKKVGNAISAGLKCERRNS